MSTENTLILPEWLLKLDDSLPSRIQEVSRIEFNETGAKQRLKEWIQKTTTAKKDASIENLKLAIENEVVAEVIRTRLIEERQVKEYSVPLKDKTVTDDFEPLEDMWEHEPLSGLDKTKDEWYRRGSGRVTKCDKCFGEGSIVCSNCNGQGIVEQKCFQCGGRGESFKSCRSCNGSGWVKETGVMVGGSHGTGLGGGIEERKVQCRTCNGTGKISSGPCNNCHGSGIERKQCGSCHGTGNLQCKQCEGQGLILKYQNIQAKAKPEEVRFGFHVDNGLQDNWLSEAKEAFAQEYKINGSLDIGKGRSLNDDERVFHEMVRVRILPVAVAKIEGSQDGKDTLYFIGSDRNVKGSGLKAFRSIKRIILFRVIPATIIAAVVIIFGINVANSPSSAPSQSTVIVHDSSLPATLNLGSPSAALAISKFLDDSGEALVKDLLEQEHPASELVQIHRMSRKIFPHGDSVHFSSEYSAIIKGAVLGVTRTAIVIQLLGVATKDQNGWIATVADRKYYRKIHWKVRAIKCHSGTITFHSRYSLHESTCRSGR